MLSGYLPFEFEGGDNSINELVKIIMVGLTKQNFHQLGQVTIESKLLISQLLVVDQDHRININEVSKHIWISKLDDDDQVPFKLSLCMQLEVGKMVQDKLKLNHLTPNQILAYVLSTKGMFGKTAGCFNLLARDLVTSSQPKMLTKYLFINPLPQKRPLMLNSLLHQSQS
jgi:serine/threonine protein kinase